MGSRWGDMGELGFVHQPPLVLRFAPDRCSCAARGARPLLFFMCGGEGGIDSGRPGPRPPGALRASKIAPAILSNPVGSSTNPTPPK